MMRIAIALLVLSIGTFRSSRGSEDPAPLQLQPLIEEALKNNPQLQAARHRRGAFETRVAQASAWDAPQVGAELYQMPIATFPLPFRENMETDYYIEQMIPFPGKRSAMEDAAKNGAAMSASDVTAIESKVIRDLKSDYYELYLVQKKIAINRENQALLKSLVDIAAHQYEVGMGKQADILRAQTELSTLINDGANLERERKVTESMINTILSRPANAPLGEVPELTPDLPAWTYAELKPLAIAHRAELASMESGIAMNKAELRAAGREYYPDLMARVMYKDMTGTKYDFWSAMLGISIPLAPWSGGQYTARVEENELKVKEAEDNYRSMENMALFEVQQALVKVESNRSQMLLFNDTIIPQAEQTLQSTIAAYRTGKTEFLMVIDAYRILFMSRLDYYKAIMSVETSQAELEQAVGMNTAEIAEAIGQ